MVGLASPVEHVVAGRKQETGGERRCQENGAEGQPYGIQDEPDVVLMARPQCLRNGRRQVGAREYADRAALVC